MTSAEVISTTGKSTGSAVEHPTHYNNHASAIEAIDVIEYLTGNMFNTVKYVWRANHKGKSVEDTEKALWYAKRELRRVITSLPEVPDEVYEYTERYVFHEADKLRASIVGISVNAHKSLTGYKDDIARVVILLEEMVAREKSLAAS